MELSSAIYGSAKGVYDASPPTLLWEIDKLSTRMYEIAKVQGCRRAE
jgi:hypothetical protein